METLNKLLDKSREMCGSDSETGKRIGVSRSAVSLWRQGGKITPEHLAKLIQLTQQDPALSVQVMAEQDSSPEEREMWETVAQRAHLLEEPKRFGVDAGPAGLPVRE